MSILYFLRIQLIEMCQSIWNSHVIVIYPNTSKLKFQSKDRSLLLTKARIDVWRQKVWPLPDRPQDRSPLCFPIAQFNHGWIVEPWLIFNRGWIQPWLNSTIAESSIWGLCLNSLKLLSIPTQPSIWLCWMECFQKMMLFNDVSRCFMSILSMFLWDVILPSSLFP